MGLKLLFVCTGNTCRSPMAEGLARAMFGDSVTISSAGMQACVGDSASTHAIEILKEQNVDISRHRSTKVRAEQMMDADWIIPMTQAQEEALKRLFPQYVAKIRYFGAWGDQNKDVIDPYGGSLDVYRQTAHEIWKLLSALKGQLAE